MQDIIRLNDLLFIISLTTGAHWPQASEIAHQPVHVTLSVTHDIRKAASTDSLSHSIDYTALAGKIRESLDSDTKFRSLEEFASHIFDTMFKPGLVTSTISALHIKVVQLKPPIHAKCVGLEVESSISTTSNRVTSQIKHFLEDIECHTIVGVNTSEREEKQVVRLNISVENFSYDLAEKSWLDFRGLIRTLYESIGNSSFFTLEALASHAAIKVLQHLRSQIPGINSAVVNIKAAKPSALVFASSSEVEIRRTYKDFPQIFQFEDLTSIHALHGPRSSSNQIAAIALGSNVGDCFYNIELALRLLEVPEHLLSSDDLKEHGHDLSVTVVNTSFLYQTSPMYVTDQPPFINCACLVETNFPPVNLLQFLKHIESAVGRTPSIRNGPRAVDLDILFYENLVIDTRPLLERVNLENLTGQLVVPHPRMWEREFVLRPLNDMIPNYIHPVCGKSISELLADLSVEDPSMRKVIPFPQYPLPLDHLSPYPAVPAVPPTLTHWTYFSTPSPRGMREKCKAHLMATLNVTPDSFSDGALHNSLHTALEYAREAINDGVTIIDIGGYSTKPGAAFVSAEEEEKRVVPIIKAIRGIGIHADGKRGQVENDDLDINSRLRGIPISVDTFRWEVAKASIIAGANCINDVYAFTGRDTYPANDDDQKKRAEACMAGMKGVAREFAVPVVLMHSRGDAGKNQDYEMYASSSIEGRGAVVEGVRIELGSKVEKIIQGKGGVRRWMVIIDPGIGFSKTMNASVEVLRQASSIVADVEVGTGKTRRNPLQGYPLLIGPSRKSFLGDILAQGEKGRTTHPKDRIWATTAAVACAVLQGSMIIRIHDTKEMADVVAIADEIWG